MAGNRKFPDLRYLFMRGLIHHEGDQRRHHYLKSAAECTSRAIVSLELADEPIKSVKQARRLEGIGGETCSRLTRIEKEREFSCLKPMAGRFVSSTGGILVALLDATEEMTYNGKSVDKAVLVSEEDIRRRAARYTEEHLAEGPNEFCKAWWRLEVLIKRDYIKRRSQKKCPVLQLLPIGKAIALKLRANVGLTSTVPPLGSGPSLNISKLAKYSLPSQMASSLPRETISIPSVSGVPESPLKKEEELYPRQPELADALYTNDHGFDGVVMLVDRREMGGERAFLGELDSLKKGSYPIHRSVGVPVMPMFKLCRLLDDNGICYRTQHLNVGDYSWLWRVNGVEVVLPCLVERKRADDIACTLKECRFWSQVNRMKQWKSRFTQRGVECAIHYILEGRPEQFVVKCDDGCQGIVRCGNPTLEQVKLVIEDLKRHPDLLVKETDNLNITAILLASLTTELKERAKKGDFNNLREAADRKPELKSNTGSSHRVTIVTSPDIKSESELADLTFDKELKAAIERSKLEVSKAHDLLNNAKDIGRENFGKFEDRKYEDNRNVVVDLDEDEEFAAVLERSKYETHAREHNLGTVDKGNNSCTFNKGDNLGIHNKRHNIGIFERGENFESIDKGHNPVVYRRGEDLRNVDKGDNFSETRPIPIMQYHCTEGGTLNYSSTSSKIQKYSPNRYRPKINKKYIPSCTIDIDNYNKLSSVPYSSDVDHSDIRPIPDEIGSKPRYTNRQGQSKFFNDLDRYTNCDKLVTRSRNSVGKDLNENLSSALNFADVVIEKFEEDSIDEIRDDKKQRKRRYSKKSFVFNPEQTNIEEAYPSYSDEEELSGNKKPKTINFQLKPSSKLLECNVLHLTKPRGSLGQVRTQFCHDSDARHGNELRTGGDSEKFLPITQMDKREARLICSKNFKGNVKDTSNDAEDLDKVSEGYDSSEDLFSYGTDVCPNNTPVRTETDIGSLEIHEFSDRLSGGKTKKSDRNESDTSKNGKIDVNKTGKRNLSNSGKSRFLENDIDNELVCNSIGMFDHRIIEDTNRMDNSTVDNDVEYLDDENGDIGISMSQCSDNSDSSLPDIGLGIISTNKHVGRNSSFAGKAECGSTSLQLGDGRLNDRINVEKYDGKHIRRFSEHDSNSPRGSVNKSDSDLRIDGECNIGSTRPYNDRGSELRIDTAPITDTIRASVSDRELEDKVRLVLSVLPDIDKDIARIMLKNCNGNVDLCVSQLLED